MLSSRFLRCIQQNNTKIFTTQILNRNFASSTSSSDSSSSSDDEKKSKKKSQKPKVLSKLKEGSEKPKLNANPKSEEALNKLNLLLKSMIEDDKGMKPDSTKNIHLAKPKGRSKGKVVETESNDIVSAAKNVAKSLGGPDQKQTEYELLNKLLNPTQPQISTEDQSKPLNLSDVLAGMKIDRSVPPENQSAMTSKAYRVKQMMDNKIDKAAPGKRTDFRRRKPLVPTNMEKIDLFGSEPLGIFTNKKIDFKESQPQLKTWEILQNRELNLAITHPPANYFQEQILWTKQGKIWKFPIDNEISMEEEKNVYFADHVFLEKHLEPWCPQRGPIRHFMELVCVGLSKNPYLTVQAKKDHIEWFKNYFGSKETYLKEIGAIPAKVEKAEEKIKELDG